ncbi:SDR family NAD(P)-dependent oxidoreductase [Massilia sp. CF038]|uniref:SDR family NAD(P)-dependent oxidoreductase n=1 Tax=Massilia sp. CF038 TaxID=1881045 RepID=UPI000920634E|nr:SDR family oxidoreductase [Massilia sp. CF038]SHG49492.1 NAD(P)-dependent dehydrogenase, short-chain alcohol dehydrogenase family [Massilia sp. CF038]
MKKPASYPSLQGKRVFITGGGSGIGEDLVAAFAAQGAQVAFVDILDDASTALCERVAKAGCPRPAFRHCDISDIAALQETMAQLAETLGDFDILVNNAASDERHLAEDVTPAFYDQCVAINQRPMFFTCQAVLPGMKRRGAGSIINLGSMSWHAMNRGYPVYCATKAAVAGLTRGLARDFGAHGIRVNTVTPGWVMTQRQVDLWIDDAARAGIKRAQCLPGALMPHDVSAMVLFLAADDSAMCTGQDFVVDGGWI